MVMPTGVLMGEYLRFTAQSTPDRVEKVLGWLGLGSVDGFIALMDQLLETKLELSEAEISQYAQKAMKTRNISFSQGQPTEEDHCARFSLPAVDGSLCSGWVME